MRVRRCRLCRKYLHQWKVGYTDEFWWAWCPSCDGCGLLPPRLEAGR